MNRRSYIYSQAAINYRDGFRNKMKAKHIANNERMSEPGIQLIRLTKIVPNWEAYLTQVQLKSTKLYLTSLNVAETSRIMKVDQSTTYVNLFGENNDHNKTLGALGRLKNAYVSLKESGYYDKLEKKKSNKN